MNLLETLNYYNLDHKKTVNSSGEPFGTNKELVGYISNYYNDLFNDIQFNKMKVVEIGSWYGGSLFLWEKFFVNSEIYGIDPNPIHNKFIPLSGTSSFIETEQKFEDYLLQSERIKFYKDDAYNSELVNKLFSDESIDILIDDGPHTVHFQKMATDFYYKKVKKGGIIIIEDVIDNHIDELITHYKTTLTDCEIEHSFNSSPLNKSLFNIITIKK